MASRPLRLSLAAAAILAAVGLYVFFRPTPPGPPVVVADPPPPDPREVFDTPFRNVRPGVKYVGDTTCAPCHPDHDAKYHLHPMGRSAALTLRATPLEKYGPADNHVTSQGFNLSAEKFADRVAHSLAAPDPALPPYTTTAAVEIGSGDHGRSYLSLEANGAVWQTPVSWFTTEGKWDVSPGFQLPAAARHQVGTDCLFCHVDRVEPVPHSMNRYREPLLAGQPQIGCERCHGPGELHAADRLAGKSPAGVDHSIVNPKHLPPDLRLAVCQQCHLLGQVRIARRGRELFEYRPGLPLEQFLAVFARQPSQVDFGRSVGQFAQFGVSKCFTASAGKMDCTSCHDPHGKPAADKTAEFYKAKCLTCHAAGKGKDCSLPAPARAAKADDCLTCHMPRGASTNIAHAAVTDHRILKVPAPSKPAGKLDGDEVPIVPVLNGPHAPPPAERERDLGVALALLTRNLSERGEPTAAGLIGVFADRRLAESLKTWPGDHDALIASAMLKSGRGDYRGMMTVAKRAVAVFPESEHAQAALAEAALRTGDTDLALTTTAKLLEMNPSAVPHREVRVNAHLRRQDWPAAEADAKAGLAFFPLHARLRAALAVSRAKQGDAAGGAKELDAAAKLTPDDRERAALREWYANLTK